MITTFSVFEHDFIMCIMTSFSSIYIKANSRLPVRCTLDEECQRKLADGHVGCTSYTLHILRFAVFPKVPRNLVISVKSVLYISKFHLLSMSLQGSLKGHQPRYEFGCKADGTAHVLRCHLSTEDAPDERSDLHHVHIVCGRCCYAAILLPRYVLEKMILNV